MRRFLGLLASLIAVIAVVSGLTSSPARADTLASCLAQHHVCVASDGRGLVSTAQQNQLEQQIGSDPIYLVVARSGSAGYNSAMNQIIATLRQRNSQFVVGFLDDGLRRFGAYNQGVLRTGGAAAIATQVVNQNPQSEISALQQFVTMVKDDDVPANSGGAGTAPGQPASTGSGDGGFIFLGIIALVAIGGYLGLVRPRQRRRKQELAWQLKEAKLAAQDDLIALNQSITDHDLDVSIQRNSAAAAEQSAALDAYERGTRALDSARTPAEMGAVSRAIAEGRYRLACAEAVAQGMEKPGRRPMCFFDPRHGMSVADVSWAPPDGGPSRTVAACIDCERIIERGEQPAMRTVQDRFGQQVVYANARFAPAYWGGFGYGGSMLTGFLLGQALAAPPVFMNGYGFEPGYGGGGDFGGGDFGGGGFGGGDFGGGFGGGDFGGGDFGGGSFGGGDFGGGGGDFGGGSF